MKIQTIKRLFIVILALSSISPAYAEHGSGWRGGWVAPAMVGGILAYDLSYPHRYYYPYPVYEQPYPIYVQAAPVQQTIPTWYYCNSARAYYPYVANCPEGWQAVAAQPPQVAPH